MTIKGILRLSSTVANNSFHENIKKSRLKNLAQQGGRSARVVQGFANLPFPLLCSILSPGTTIRTFVMVSVYRKIFSFGSSYDCLTSAANLRAICTFLSPLEGLDLNGESNNACRDILDSFLRMLRGLSWSPSEAAADSGSLAIFTISVCSIMWSCE